MYGAVERLKDVCYFGTDEEGHMTEALRELEGQVLGKYGEELHAMVPYDEEWTYRVYERKLEDGALFGKKDP